MTALRGPRLDELFARHWDNVLTAAEADELAKGLAADAAARDAFQFLCAQAVAIAELPGSTRVRGEAGELSVRGWSRRRALGLLGAGLAAGVAGVGLGWRYLADGAGGRVTVAAVQGRVTVRTADGRRVSAEGRVPPGATVSTEGLGAVAVLSYPDGSTVALIGDSALTVAAGGRHLRLHQGTANADLRPRPATGDRLTLITALVTLAGVSGTTITLGQGARSTEVEVHQGTVRVATADGEPLAVLRGGELLTVGANGARHQEPTPLPPDAFAWDLAAPLPDGWQVGRRDATPDGPVVRPVTWPDPYYDHATMFQVRSNHQWTRGLFSLVEGSVVHVRYRARLPSPKGQVCFCVRTPRSHSSGTGMLEYGGGFGATGTQWAWLRVRAGDMLANRHTPKFGPPWIGFQVILNTFEADVGLEVAEFRVSPPGLPPV